MAARVDGRPIPFSFNASRSSSLSTSLPAVSIARSKVASVYGRGGCVHFSSSLGRCGPLSPFTKAGKECSSSLSRASASGSVIPSGRLVCGLAKITRHPGSRICFPVALNSILSASPITVVVANLQSG